MAEKKKKLDGVAIGRVAHFVEADGDHSAAMITYVGQETTVNLFVMRSVPYVDNRAVQNVEYSEEPKPGTWHFPERE